MKLCRIRDFNREVGQNFSVDKKVKKTDDRQRKYMLAWLL